MSWAFFRAAVVLGALPVLAAVVARPPVPGLVFVVAGLGAVLGFAGRSALLVLFLRRGLAKVSAGAPPSQPLLGNLAGALLGAGVAAPVALLLESHGRAALALGGLVALLPAAALAWRTARRDQGPRTLTLARWLLVETALPSGLLAASAGAGAVWLRLHGTDMVPPGELARHLGGTVWLYALLLGLGSFLKARAELQSGLVLVAAAAPLPERAGPGPILVGALVGTALLLSAPLLPALPFATVLTMKTALGLVGGAGLSVLGALQGALATTRSRPSDLAR